MRLLLLLVVLLAGCATVQKERQLLLAPAPLNSTASKDSLQADYQTILVAAQGNPNPMTIGMYVDAGNTINVLHCTAWLDRVTASKRGLVLSDKNVNVLEGLATTLMGIAKASSQTVAVVGALEAAGAGISTNVQTDLLLAPSAYTVQTTLLGLLDSCSSQLLRDAPGLSFGQAFTRLETCSRVCSFESAQAAANNALSRSVFTVHPVSGAIQ